MCPELKSVPQNNHFLFRDMVGLHMQPQNILISLELNHIANSYPMCCPLSPWISFGIIASPSRCISVFKLIFPWSIPVAFFQIESHFVISCSYSLYLHVLYYFSGLIVVHSHVFYPFFFQITNENDK